MRGLIFRAGRVEISAQCRLPAASGRADKEKHDEKNGETQSSFGTAAEKTFQSI
jgi:hypothetical protein